VFAALRRATGVDVLEDMSEFFRSFGGMVEGFRERAEHVSALLADSRTAFLIVTTPAEDAVEEAMFFHHRLLDAGLPFAGVVANRVHEPPAAPGEDLLEEVGELVGPELAAKVLRNLEDYRRLAERDARALERLQARLGRRPMIRVPELDEDVHDVAGLWRMNEYLFGEGGAGGAQTGAE
jgi:anion-transporting  ArsA/GET3 family ATPase